MYMAKKFVDGNKELSFYELDGVGLMKVTYFSTSGSMTTPVAIFFEEKNLIELRTFITQQLNKKK